MTVASMLTSLTQRFLEAPPRPLPGHALVRVLELEDEPTTMLVLGHDFPTIRLLREAFPDVVLDVVDAEHACPVHHDTVVLAGVAPAFIRDGAFLDGLIAGLPVGGHLAMAYVRPGNPRSNLSLPGMRALHVSERRSWRGDWTETVYVGRKLPA